MLTQLLFEESGEDMCHKCQGTGIDALAPDYASLCGACDGSGEKVPQCTNLVQWGKRTCRNPARYSFPEKVKGQLIPSPRCTECATSKFGESYGEIQPDMTEKYPRTDQAQAFLDDMGHT